MKPDITLLSPRESALAGVNHYELLDQSPALTEAYRAPLRARLPIPHPGRRESL